MSMGRICISSKLQQILSEQVNMEIHGAIFETLDHEIGSWSINIVDESDVSSTGDVNEMEKDVISSDASSVDGMEEVIKNLHSGMVDRKPTIESPKEKFIDTSVAKETNSSDLSCPPGFKYLKKDSTRRCSTSFAKRRNKEVKGISIFHEFSRLIEVGGAMGLEENDKLENLEAMDSIQKAHIKWDVEGDENSKYFHTLIKQKCRSNSITGIMHEGLWVTDPQQIKESFLNFFKQKFQANDSLIDFLSLNPSARLNDIDHVFLETYTSMDEVKAAVWGCRSDKAPGIHYKIVAKVLANRLSKVVDKIVSQERTAFIANRQTLNGPLILSEAIDWSWIKACIESSRTSILISGSPTSELNVKRGLIQGDPLSPFLFIIIMEGFHLSILDSVRSLFRGINIGSSGGLSIGSLKAFNLALLQNGDGDSSLTQTLYGLKLIELFVVVKAVSIKMVAISTVFGPESWGLLITSILVPLFLWIPLDFKLAAVQPLDFLERHLACVRNSSYLDQLIVDISHLEVKEGLDKCLWSTSHDGTFSVGALRRLIDDHLFTFYGYHDDMGENPSL
nr:RNA-directed DNA polymerase, eukaryota, reverse transcriptase zinc-binding domain protein [Tanacetum cinerariifolium]